MFTSGSYLIYGKNSKKREVEISKITQGLNKNLSRVDPTLIIIEAEGSIGIDQVRNLQKSLKLKAGQGESKLAIIKNAERATVEAQNALLKILEEPPDNSIILLETETSGNLLPTVVSRCQKIFAGDGTQLSFSQEESQKMLDDNKIIFESSLSNKFVLARELAQKTDEWFEKESLLLRDLLILKIKAKASLSNEKIADDLLKLSQGFTLEEIVNFLKILGKIRQAVEANANPRFALEILFLEAPNLAS